MIEKLYVQLCTVGRFMQTPEDIRATFKKLKEIGYSGGQTAGSGGVTYQELADIAKECDFEIIGTHYDPQLLINNFDETVEVHKYLGTTNFGVGGGHMAGTSRQNLEDYLVLANSLADKLSKHGMKYTYHNHWWEFDRMSDADERLWDKLVEGLDKEKTSFVLDTYWVAYTGSDVVYWIEQLKDRIDIIHLKDRGYTKVQTKSPEEDPIQLDITEVGYGNLNWDGIMEACEKSGVKYYCVEQEKNFINDDPFESLKASAEFLKKYM